MYTYAHSNYIQAYHIDDHFSESLSFIRFKVLQKVTIRILRIQERGKQT